MIGLAIFLTVITVTIVGVAALMKAEEKLNITEFIEELLRKNIEDKYFHLFNSPGV
jgi:hypothetical protein